MWSCGGAIDIPPGSWEPIRRRSRLAAWQQKHPQPAPLRAVDRLQKGGRVRAIDPVLDDIRLFAGNPELEPSTLPIN